MSFIDATEAAHSLKQGELVALPTETVYGLAGRVDREDTLRRIFTVKGRPFFDPLIVHVANLEAAKRLTSHWPKIFDVLTQSFWPGPLTVVAPKSPSVSSLITSGLDTVAIRCPRHDLTLQVLREIQVPVAAPSANLFGHTSPTTAAHVEAEFSGQISVLDGGPCEIGVESTVVTAREDQAHHWIIEILRPGGVSREQIHDVLKRAGIKFSIERKNSEASPGHLKHHYQPDSPIVLVPTKLADDKILAAIQKSLPSIRRVSHLPLNSDPRQAARDLYQNFRELSAPETAIVISYSAHHLSTEWEAVWDRIERAATLRLDK